MLNSLALVLSLLSANPSTVDTEVERWQRQAQRVTIVRDDWGIAHIRGISDADVVFGLMYSQAEDDFNRVETSWLKAMGRVAEAEGEAQIFNDLRMKLFVDPKVVQARYASSPAWLKTLMIAWADGLNFYLHEHPEVKPRVITRFEPWMVLTWVDGNASSEYEIVSVPALEAFYGKRQATGAVPRRDVERTLSGSNGIAIAPSNTANRRSLLLINPHTTLMYRAEVQLTSEEGLNSYGAVTWGQFFVFQGFNDRAGWMHTSTGADAADEYLETVERRADGVYYRYGNGLRRMISTKVRVPYRTASGMASREFTVYRTHRGPIVREVNGKWVSRAMMYEPVKGLTQSFTRMKARDIAAFRRTLDLHTNSTNNTVYADANGTIAYFHANFVPRRDSRFDWSRPVDGSDPATEWRGVHSVAESPLAVNPKSGWVMNTNNWPYSAAGPHSPERSDFPRYMDEYLENPRGIHAMALLTRSSSFTLESLITAAYDSYLTAFDTLLPPLLADYDRLSPSDSLKGKVAEQIAALRGWDRRWSLTSVPTTLAVRWAEQLWRSRDTGQTLEIYSYLARGASARQRVEALAIASERLESEFGNWRTPWGEINRFQRITGDIQQPFSDAAPSVAIPFTSAGWGSLAALEATQYNGSKRQYGTSGNSFVAVVEFGDRVRAKAISAGGQSGDPRSPHFNDQALRYSRGDLREVYFYDSQLEGHTERRYHPGRSR